MQILKNSTKQNSAHFYRNQPSLQTPKNNPLVLLTSLIIQDQPHRVLSGWAASDDGWSLYRRLIRDIQHPQTTEQLALTLAALLCYRRLLPYFPNDTTQSIRGCCYLGEFDALISGELSGNERTVLEYMILSFLWALNTFDDDHQGLRQLLATLLDTETTVELRDIFSVQYWVRRMKYRLPHSDAFGKHPSFRLPRGKVAAIPSLWVSKPSLRCYNWWTFAPIVLLLIRYNPVCLTFLNSQLKLPAVIYEVLSHPWFGRFFSFRLVVNPFF